MYIKKILSLLTTVSIVLSTVGVCAETSNVQEKQPYAQIYFDGTGENVHIKNYSFPASPIYATHKGVQTFGLSNSNVNAYGSYIDIDDELYPNDVVTPAAITVRYFDKGAGYFSLRYVTPTAKYVEPEQVNMTDSGEWKEYTFYLDDFMVNNGLGNADFVISSWTLRYGWSREPVYIQWIKVEKVFPQQPISVSVTSERIGNIFDKNDDKKLTVNVTNISDETLSVHADYEVTTYDGKVISSGETEPVECEGRSTSAAAIVDVNDVSDNYGCYYLKVKTYSEGDVEGVHKAFETETADYDYSVIKMTDEGHPPNELIKMNGHWSYQNSFYIAPTDAELMSQIGVSGIRDGLSWANVERSTGVYESEKLSSYLDDFAEKDLDSMIILAFSNSLYTTKSGHVIPETPEQINGWKKYVDYVTKTYADKVDFWEFWNEPNLTQFNASGLTGAEYAEIAKLTYEIVKKNDPDSTFVTLATSGVPMEFIKSAVEEGGILDYTDMVTIHPYDWTQRGAGVDFYHRNDYFINRIKDLQTYFAEQGHPDIPIVIGEMGISTTEDNQWGSQVSQASYLLQQFLMTEGEDLADIFYVYEWATDGIDPNDQEQNWGLIKCSQGNVPFAARPAYVMLSAYNNLLTDVETEGIIEHDETTVYRFRRNADGKQVIALWNEKGSDSFALNLGTDNVQVIDMYGNVKGILSEEDGIYDVQTTFEPFYLIGDFTKFDIADPVVSIENGRIYAAPNDDASVILADAQGRNLAIQVQAANALEIKEIKNLEGGVGQVTFHTSADAVKDNAAVINVYEDDVLVYTTKVHICITEPVSAYAEVIPQSADNATRYLARVHVSNITNSAELSGKVVADFSDIGGELEIRSFEKVKPGETISVTLNLPEQIVKRTLDAKGHIELDYGYTIPVDFNLSAINIGYAGNNPNMTGYIDFSWWNGGDWFAADDAYAARYYTNWGGVSDCSFLGTAKWDEENFYLMIIASDDRFAQFETGHYTWKGDGVQFCIAPLKDDGSISAEFTEFGLSKTTSGMLVYRYNSQTMYNMGTTGLESNVSVENADLTVEQIDGKYVYRAKIPWTEIFGSGADIEANRTMGFSVILNDNDGSDRFWVEYTSGIGNFKDTSLFGKLTLKK